MDYKENLTKLTLAHGFSYSKVRFGKFSLRLLFLRLFLYGFVREEKLK